MTATPEFLRWSLRHPCRLRDASRAADVEHVARQLFALRAAGDAVVEGRVCEGIAWETSAGSPSTVSDDPQGFRLDDVFAAYGGRDEVDSACRGCPANVTERLESSLMEKAGQALEWGTPWAGCFGIVDWSSWGADFLSRVDTAVARVAGVEVWNAVFLETHPTWYGIWAATPVPRAGLELLEVLLADLLKGPSEEPQEGRPDEQLVATSVGGPWISRGLGPLAAAVRIALRDSRLLDVKLFPSGRVVGKRWEVAVHCGRCGAARMDPRRACPVCRFTAAAQPARRRAAQGTRPYWPLSRQLGRETTHELLERYWRQRGASS